MHAISMHSGAPRGRSSCPLPCGCAGDATPASKECTLQRRAYAAVLPGVLVPRGTRVADVCRVQHQQHVANTREQQSVKRQQVLMGRVPRLPREALLGSAAPRCPSGNDEACVGADTAEGQLRPVRDLYSVGYSPSS